MIKEYIYKFKNILKKDKEENKNNKKQIENLVVFLILLIITVISINVIWKKDSNNNDNENDFVNIVSTEDTTLVNSSNITISTDLEERLTNILSQVNGIGEVSVMISYSTTSTVVPMYNETKSTTVTEETDSSGGTRTVSEDDYQKEIIYKEGNSQKEPITQSVTLPEISGVIVVCDRSK